MNTFQYISDVHTEFYKEGQIPIIAPHAEYLILAGDIGIPSGKDAKVYFKFLNNCSNSFKKVFLIMGNHESYYDTISNTKINIKNNLPENVIFLDTTRYDINDSITILGCTLWSEIKKEQAEIIRYVLSDFKIKDWTIEENNKTHEKERSWLLNQVNKIRINEPHRKIIVVTHHAPVTRGTSHPEFDNSPITSAFSSDLKYMINPPIAYWVSGHTHYSNELIVNNVNIVSYQIGYPDEKKTGYSKELNKVFRI